MKIRPDVLNPSSQHTLHVSQSVYTADRADTAELRCTCFHDAPSQNEIHIHSFKQDVLRWTFTVSSEKLVCVLTKKYPRIYYQQHNKIKQYQDILIYSTGLQLRAKNKAAK